MANSKARFKCLSCEHQTALHRKKGTDKIIMCPECKGALVDTFYYNKYKFLLQPKETDDNLLTIKIRDVNSPPKLTYKGKEINKKRKIYVDWESDGPATFGNLDIDVEYIDESEGKPVIKRIGESRLV